jgi:hypothetical protein
MANKFLVDMPEEMDIPSIIRLKKFNILKKRYL